MFSFNNIIKFDCNENWRKNGHDINPKGFFKSYSSTFNDNLENVHDEIILFGKKCDFWSALDIDSDWLHNMTRKVLLELQDSEVEVPKPYEKDFARHESSTCMNKAALNLRSDVSIFLYYIDYYLKVCLHYPERCILTTHTTLKLESMLDNLSMFVHHLDKYFLSEQFLVQCSIPDGKLHCNVAYQLIHCCLDFRWFYILIKYKLKDVKNFLKRNFPRHANYMENDDNFLLLMSELVFTSIVKYDFVRNNSFIEDVLICPCIKEIWVLLFNCLGLEGFWNYFNQVLHTLLEVGQSPNNEILKNLNILSFQKFKSINASEFTIYLLKEIAKLKDYIVCKTDYPINTDDFTPFYDNVKHYLISNPSEKSLRAILRVINSIMNDWELEKERVIVLLWEHLYKKIHTLSISCSDCKSSSTNISGNSFLNEVKSRFLPTAEPNRNENSFGLFLRMIAVHAQKGRFKGATMKNLYSRIQIKFDVAKKFQTYSSVGLYNTSSLFLTAAIIFGVEKEVKKLRDLMITRSFLNLSQQEKIVKWKTLVACLLLLAENGYNARELVDDILNDVRLALSKNNTTLMPIFIECVKVLIENRNNYMSALSIISSLTGDWIERYVTISQIHERGTILSVYDPLIADLREGAEWWSGEETEEIKKELFSHVLPAVKLNVYPCVARTAAQFFSFFLRNKNWAHAYSLYSVWMPENDSVAVVTSEFIISYYEIEGDLSKLALFKRDYEIDVVRCFIKYHLLNDETGSSHRLFTVVKFLPTITHYAGNVGYNWIQEDGNLIGFIRLFGACLNSFSSSAEKSSIKLLFNNYFAQLGEWCKTGLVSSAPKSVVNNIYHCCASIVAECHSVIYEKNQSSILTVIVEKVFLPISEYSNYSELPRTFAEAVNEHLPLFIRGLLKLHKNGGPHISDLMQDIVDFNFPRSPEFTESIYEAHPFYKCLLDVEIVREFSTILERMFLTKSCKLDNKGENCIRLFSLISCPLTRDIIFSNVIYTILNAVMEKDYSSVMLKCALDYINKCVNKSLDCRKSLKMALERIAANQSLFCTGNFGNLLEVVRSICPGEMLRLPSLVKEEIGDP